MVQKIKYIYAGSLATRSKQARSGSEMDYDYGSRSIGLCGIRHGIAPALTEMGMGEPKLSIGMDLTDDCWDEPE